jgi:REP element-mobilizing transposase RayT
LRELIAGKRAWAGPLDAAARERGFRGWHARGYLPHFDAPGRVQFVTFRLHDAMPASRRWEWAAFLDLEDARERRTKIEAYLDRGLGECHLRQPAIAKLVEDALLHFDGARYQMLSWVVMPNHVHALFEVTTTPLDEVMHSWKSFTAKQANALLDRQGPFWEEEYFDRYMRDEAHFRKTVRYLENNPVNARLVREPAQRPWGSARRRVETEARA